jgi:hypothetical protein
VIAPGRRVPTVIAGMFGAASFRRAEELVPRVEAWRPDVVIHPITELAGAVAAERAGARRLVHGFGPLPAEAWDWFGARFGELCEVWDVAALADDIVATPFVELCPPPLQRDAVAAFGHRVPTRPTSGDVRSGERLPWPPIVLGLLGHCAAIVSQGGPATILAALADGLPHLILPQGARPVPERPCRRARRRGAVARAAGCDGAAHRGADAPPPRRPVVRRRGPPPAGRDHHRAERR